MRAIMGHIVAGRSGWTIIDGRRTLETTGRNDSAVAHAFMVQRVSSIQEVSGGAEAADMRDYGEGKVVLARRLSAQASNPRG